MTLLRPSQVMTICSFGGNVLVLKHEQAGPDLYIDAFRVRLSCPDCHWRYVLLLHPLCKKLLHSTVPRGRLDYVVHVLPTLLRSFCCFPGAPYRSLPIYSLISVNSHS